MGHTPLAKMARVRLLALGKRHAASWPSLYRVSREVKAALAQNRPVVALESTIITHGMVKLTHQPLPKTLKNPITEPVCSPTLKTLKRHFRWKQQCAQRGRCQPPLPSWTAASALG